MKVWTGAIIRLDDGTLAQVKRIDGGLVEAHTSAGETAIVHEDKVVLASFDEQHQFRQQSQPPSVRHAAGQKRLEI